LKGIKKSRKLEVRREKQKIKFDNKLTTINEWI
jgi:hypothetical protein